MTYPPPSQWQDPARSDPSSAPPVDPTRSMTDPPVPAQSTGTDPYAPAEPVPGQPVADAYAAPAYTVPAYPAAGYPPAGYPPPTGYPAYPYPPIRQTNSLALVSLILSVMGVASCVTAPIGAILGHVARRQIRERGEDGDGLAKAGIIVGWVLTGLIGLAIVGYILLIVFAVSQSSSSTY
ncbi:DUF4190 domain-containing protein [Micromonospora sp. NPDC050187]|uniref:DUF4190 domain-containing protein n=1 Tax=Micromonospora sp. NPDC050187 TaxID=3364277 RepID=UPI0037A3D892